jgi:ABC-type transport system substrate-binding protein
VCRGNTFGQFGPEPDLEFRWDWYQTVKGGTIKGTVKDELYNPWCYWHGPEALKANDLIDKGALTYDQEQRKLTYYQLQELFAEEMPYCILNFADVLSQPRLP